MSTTLPIRLKELEEKGRKKKQDRYVNLVVSVEQLLKLCQALRTAVYHLEKYEAVFTGPSPAAEALTEIRAEVSFE